MKHDFQRDSRYPGPSPRRSVPAVLILIAWAAVAFLFSGCDQIYRQHNEQLRDAAESKAAAKEYKEAVALYEASLDETPESALVHYKLGLLYDGKLGRPISAVHHFQRYLDLAPKGSHARDVRNMIEEDNLKLLTRHGNGATVPQHEAVRLKNDNLALRKRVLELRTELEAAAEARAQILKSLGRSTAPEQTQKDLVPGVRTYTVQRGDTLASISRKFYKSPAHWRRIQDANFNLMRGTATLKVGMVLMIP